MKLNTKIMELIAIGASLTANCQPCIKYHLKAAKDLGVTEEEIEEVLKLAKAIKIHSSKVMDKFTKQIMSGEIIEEVCCPEEKKLGNNKISETKSCCS